MTAPIGNRETRRRARKSGDLDANGEPVQRRSAPTAPPPRTKEERTGARQFVREVRQELRKVAWPTRGETVHYSLIVLSTLVVMTALIFVLDYAFSKGVLNLFDV
jgi:preprotein translocase subunit SecE